LLFFSVDSLLVDGVNFTGSSTSIMEFFSFFFSFRFCPVSRAFSTSLSEELDDDDEVVVVDEEAELDSDSEEELESESELSELDSDESEEGERILLKSGVDRWCDDLCVEIVDFEEEDIAAELLAVGIEEVLDKSLLLLLLLDCPSSLSNASEAVDFEKIE